MQKCVDLIVKTLKLDKQFGKTFKQLHPEIQARFAENALESLDDTALKMLKNMDTEGMDKLARSMVNNKLIKAFTQKRNAMLDEKILQDGINFIKTEFADNPALGMEAFLVGVNSVRQGSRSSVAARQAELEQSFFSSFILELDQSGLLKGLREGKLDDAIADALFKLRQGDVDVGKSVAGKIATVIQKHQERLRLMANDYGASIGYLPAYIARQTHDVYKLRQSTKAEWVDFVYSRVDEKRTFKNLAMPEKERLDMLGKMYDEFTEGAHMHGGETKGGSNLAKRMSQERILHFANSKSWMEYNSTFGGGNLRESIVDGFSYMALNIALLQKLGTNPTKMFNKIAEGADVNIKTFRVNNAFAVVSGLTRVPVGATLAKVSSILRAFNNMSKLGGAVVSALADIPLYASEVNYGGGTLLGGYAQAVKNLTTRTGADKREIAQMLGVFSNSMKGQLASRFGSADDVPNKINAAQNIFFKLNLLNWWTHSLEEGFALGLSNRLARNSNLKLSEISDELSRYFKMYDIDEVQWNIIRKHTAKKADDGEMYLTPEGIRNVDDAEIKAVLPEGSSKADIRRYKYELENRMREMIIDRSKYAVIQPDARTKGIMTQGSQAGTVLGEFARFASQFKSFPIAILQKSMGREIHGKTGDMARVMGVAHLVVGMTIFGYLAMTAKDMLRGKKPRDPRNWKTFLAASMQGGAVGIYGDFLFRDLSHYGGGAAETAIGPVLGEAGNIGKAFSQAFQGDIEGSATSLTRSIVQNIPYINLFYTRTVLDYMVLHQLYEFLSPNYTRRMEKRLKKDYNQEYFLPPSSYVR